MAQTHNEMDTYADSLKDCTPEERSQIAVYYEGKGIWDKAAKQYEEAKNPLKALKLFIKLEKYSSPSCWNSSKRTPIKTI